MAEDLPEIWNPFNLSPFEHPSTLPPPNENSLSEAQKLKLNEQIISNRIDQTEYLNAHPEIKGIIREYFQVITTQRPSSQEIPKFCREFFGQCKFALEFKAKKHVNDFLSAPKKYSKDFSSNLLDFVNTEKNVNSWYWSSDSDS